MFNKLNNNIIKRLYAKKANLLKVSPLLLDAKATKELNLIEIIKCSDNKCNFDKEVMKALLCEESNFLDFSLIMGLFFGVYNQYQYEYINYEVKKKIVDNKPNSEQIKEVVKHNIEKIYMYLAEKYNIDKKTFDEIIFKMFVVEDVDEDTLYERKIANVIGKIILGNYLYLLEISIKNSTFLVDCEDAINFIDKLNKKSSKKI